MNAAIVAEQLTKRYAGTVALRDVDIHIPEGLVTGLIGPNGSGKSTLLKIAAGLLTPTAGRITIGGHVPVGVARSLVSFVPDVNTFHRWMTVADAVWFFSRFYPDFDADRARLLLDELEVDLAKQTTGLSKGQKSRLRLALGLARQTPVLLLDEPLSGIDPYSRDKIIEALGSAYRRSGQTVVISTHEVDEVEPWFDHVVVLKGGEVVIQGAADDLRAAKNQSIEGILKEVCR